MSHSSSSSPIATSPVLPPLRPGLIPSLLLDEQEDRLLSPYTGVTRRHWVALAEHLLDTAREHRSASGARIVFPGTPSRLGVRSDGLEGFSRTFLLAAFLHVGEPTAGRTFVSEYMAGMIAATTTGADRPSDAWEPIGHIDEVWAQSQVEAACIALSLHLTRDAGWDTLSPAEQTQIETWLRSTLDKEPAPNNWYLFPLTTASFLEAVGRGDDETAFVVERGLALADEWYRADGWYSDGDGEAFDHYVGWAMHFYPVLHALLRGRSELLVRLGDRLSVFLESFSLLFDRNGAPLHLGRSLTYRIATVASIGLGEVVGRTPLSHGQSRRIMSADLRYFVERGAIENGVLGSGWHGPHRATLQDYSGPGSPYWASKGFIGLMLPPGHPLWTATEEGLPTDERTTVLPIAATGLLIQATTADGIVRVHNHGSDHITPAQPDSGAPDPLYSRFAYSTRTGPTPLHQPSDNDFQVAYRDVWSARRRIHRVGSGDDWVASWHAPRFAVYSPFSASGESSGGPTLPSSRVQSVVIAHGALEVRIHRLRHVPPGSPVRASGWALASDDRTGLRSSAEGVSSAVVTRGDERLSSRLHGIVGWERSSTVEISTGTAFGRWAAVPELYGTASSGLFVAVAQLSQILADEPSPPAPLTSEVAVLVEGDVITANWADGAVSRVDLDELRWS